MQRVSGWTITSPVHARFAQLCKCNKNSKLSQVNTLFLAEPHISYTRHAQVLVKCKNLAQWKARTLAASVPQEAVLAIRSLLEAVRLLARRFIYDSSPGDALCSSVRNKSYFMDNEANDWLSQ